MFKIRDTAVNDIIKAPLVVMSATARETKAKKPYLSLELFDGTDIIQGNYWDWTSGKIPTNNTILDVSAQVTEYMGTKQLNIKALSVNTEMNLCEFQPNAGINIGEVYKEAYALTSEVKDSFLRSVTLEILEKLSSFWHEVPGAKGVHHAFVGGALVHCVSVAKIALAISQQLPDSNDDLCFVGGLLHDLGKLFTYKLDGLAISMTDEGQLFDHTYLGARFLNNFAEQLLSGPTDLYKLEVLEHIILSHHGLLEYGAAVPPMCIEAHIVNRADGVDAAAQQVIEQSRKLGNVKWTDRIYALGNKPHLTPQYLKEVFSTEASNEELLPVK